MSEAPKPNLLLISVGSFLGSMTVSGFVLGYFTDLWLGTEPWFLLAFGFLGLIGGMLKAFKMLTRPDTKLK